MVSESDIHGVGKPENVNKGVPSEYGVESGTGYTKISPTDISQFIRLEQCHRYLRLRLHERAHGRDFLSDYGVYPQTIPPLLTRSGQSFEDAVEKAVFARHPSRNLAKEGSARRESDNDLLEHVARSLLPGEIAVLFQLRLDVPLGEWWFRGDIDILRLERSEGGTLHLLIADMKSSAEAKTEHRLQAAFYHEMLAALFAQQDVAYGEIKMGILYRGAVVDIENLTPQELARIEEQSALATEMLGVDDAFLEIALDAQSYLDSVHDLVTASDSAAHKMVEAPFEELNYHLTHKCDGCFYNEFCMKWTAELNDLSLVPHLTGLEKEALRRKGLNTVFDLALLKDFKPDADGKRSCFRLRAV